MKAIEIVALSAPEPSALLAQLLEHRAEFLGFLTRRVGDPAAAEDILQAAYTKALEKGEQIQHTESVVAWFYRMLRNTLVDHYRRNAARTRAHDQFVAEAPLSYETEDEANLCACVGVASDSTDGTGNPEQRGIGGRDSSCPGGIDTSGYVDQLHRRTTGRTLRIKGFGPIAIQWSLLAYSSSPIGESLNKRVDRRRSRDQVRTQHSEESRRRVCPGLSARQADACWSSSECGRTS